MTNTGTAGMFKCRFCDTRTMGTWEYGKWNSPDHHAPCACGVQDWTAQFLYTDEVHHFTMCDIHGKQPKAEDDLDMCLQCFMLEETADQCDLCGKYLVDCGCDQ